MEKLNKIEKLLELLQNDTITPKQVEQFLTYVLSYIKKERENIEELSAQRLLEIESAVQIVDEKMLQAISGVNEKSNEYSNIAQNKIQEIELQLSTIKELIQEIKSIEIKNGEDGKDGKDADEQKIIEEVSKLIPKEITGESVVNKINELPIEDEYKIDASHIKNLPEAKVISNSNKYLDQLLDVNLSGLTKDSENRYILGGGGSTYTFQGGVTESGGVVELGGNGALTSLNINGTNGNGHIHLKHQSVAPNSQTSASTIYADVNGRAGWVNDGLGVETLAYKSEVDGKANISHTHTIANVTGLQTELDSKLSPSSIGTTVQSFNSNTTLLGNTTTGTGSIVKDTSPTLVTPTLGVASATSINKVAFTQPATGATLTILDGKTLTVNNTITLAGTDSRVYTFPTTNATIARTDAAQTFTGVQTFANAINGANGADIASAATTDIGAATGNYVNITGTTTITSLGTSNAGVSRTVQFAGILTLTHNATSLILPTGANITTAAGDVAMFQSLGTGNWRCTGYMRANGQPLAGGGSTDISCRVTRTSNYNGSIGTGAAVAIPWDAETFDTNTMHDNVTNPSRITFNTAGKYQINVVLIPSQNLANGAYAWIRLNGSTNISGTLNKGINLSSAFHVYHLSFSELYSFSAGDYIEIMGQGNSGTFDVSLNSYVTAIRMA